MLYSLNEAVSSDLYFVSKTSKLVIIQERYQLGKYIFVFVLLAINLSGCKITYSNRRALKTARK